MRGYFGIGIEGSSKPMNAGNLFRSANAFGASFVFTVGGATPRGEVKLADTSDTPGQVPFYDFEDAGALELPGRCVLVGVELLDEAIELPSFRHPRCAAYVLGPERGYLSDALTGRCEFVIKIPSRFCINVATAGAIVMYDRITSLGRFPGRPVVPGGPVEPLAPHVRGAPVRRKKAASH
ncbi:MAG: RNA methyltransferase [Proteobacteria bacterium]|nr:RNA methyltransferase [Pseudomonadota bacterium]